MVIPSRIAFGSCNEQNLVNNMWPIIEKRDPAAFIWGGDAIYGDYYGPLDWSQFPPKEMHYCADPHRLRDLYRQQKSTHGYQKLLKKNITVFGTFDDHDYGCNNADRTYEHRYQSGLEFISFIGQPVDSPMSRRVQAGLGVYGVKLFDFARPEGQQELADDEAMIDPDVSPVANMSDFSSMPMYSNQSVAVFVLDVRSNKSPWRQGSEAYTIDYEGDFLGEDQWQWFEAAIQRSRAAVNVIVSGLQFHSNMFPDPNLAEAWDKFPRSQQRLFDAVLQDGVQAPILISGDVHMTQLMRKDCERADGRSTRRSLMEMTTSGMTHSWGTVSSPPVSNPRQVPSLAERYQSFVASTVMEVLHFVSPWTDLLKSQAPTEDGLYGNGGQEGATQGLQYSLEKNFGELEFDWLRRTVTMRSMSEHPGAPPLLAASWSIDQLNGKETISGSLLTSQDFAAETSSQRGGEWVCINHRGNPSFFWQLMGHVSAAAILATMLPFPMLIPLLVILVIFPRPSQKGSSKLHV